MHPYKNPNPSALSQFPTFKGMEEIEDAEMEFRFQEDDPLSEITTGTTVPNLRRPRFARGGPIFVPDLIGPLTSIHAFISSLDLISSLEAELDSTADFEDELGVEELRVYSEEELVERALREGFQDDSASNATASQPMENGNGEEMDHSSFSGKEIVCLGNSINENSNLANEEDSSGPKLKRKRSKKRGRVFDRHSRAAELEGSYMAKVEEIAKIKQKQDEDKLAARLHSFSGCSMSVKGESSTSEKNERMRSLRFITSPLKLNSCGSQEHVPLDYPEVVLCVEIYHHKKTTQKTQEFLVLGSQILSDLRDKIYCLTDELMKTAEQHDPSGYFLIEDTFCNDMRDPSSTDYSKPIFEWLENRKNEALEKWDFVMSGELKKTQKEMLGDVDVSHLPNFKAVSMSRTRFSDLHFRLAAGYLYCHQGNCKHSMVIRDMRLVHPEDEQNRAEYPLLTFQIKHQRRKCFVCKIFHATKVTVDDKWAQYNPCYFCIKCYFLLHYKEDGSLMYSHTVFDYYHE